MREVEGSGDHPIKNLLPLSTFSLHVHFSASIPLSP
jgi:hypothetical protein